MCCSVLLSCYSAFGRYWSEMAMDVERIKVVQEDFNASLWSEKEGDLRGCQKQQRTMLRNGISRRMF
jgi:hypothetical protein